MSQADTMESNRFKNPWCGGGAVTQRMSIKFVFPRLPDATALSRIY